MATFTPWSAANLPCSCPIGRHHFVPLPVQHIQIIRRPGAGDPVGRFGIGAVAGAARKIHHRADAQLFGQQDGLPAGLAMLGRDFLVGMQRIAVAGQRRNGQAGIGDLALEGLEFVRLVQQRQMQMRVAGIIAGAEFHHLDAHGFQLLQHVVQRQRRQQRREYTDFHDDTSAFMAPQSRVVMAGFQTIGVDARNLFYSAGNLP